jgi:hypothetical protein
MIRSKFREISSPTAVLRRASLFFKSIAVTVAAAFLGLYFLSAAIAANSHSRTLQ